MGGTAARLAVGLFAVLALARCAHVRSGAARPQTGDSVQPLAEAAGGVFIAPGEQMVWEVRWGDVLLARLRQSTGQPGVIDGHRAAIVRTAGNTAGVLALLNEAGGEAATAIDLRTGLPLQTAGSLDDMYSGDALEKTWKGHGKHTWKPWPVELAGGEPAYETHAALAAMRAWRPQPGDRAYFYGRVEYKVYRTDLLARGIVDVTTATGTHSALRIDGLVARANSDLTHDPEGDRYPFILWISNDRHRQILRIHVQSPIGGLAIVELVSFDAAN